MALSYLDEDIQEVSEVKRIVDVVMSMLDDPNPMICYTVCYAIGQIFRRHETQVPTFLTSHLQAFL